MADFADALPYVLQHEGGWSYDRDDPGGATMMGITMETAQRHGIRTVGELRQITPEVVASIYHEDYWRFDAIYNQRVAAKLFDMSVNMGPRSAIRLVQMALNGLGASLVVDGYCGPKTIASINAVHPERMLDMLVQASADRYRAIVEERPASAKFLKGWLKRAADVPHA